MAAGAAAAAAVVEAIKASGVVVRLNPGEFRNLMMRVADPLVVMAQGGILSTRYPYMTSYKGTAFFTESKAPLKVPARAEIVSASRIWIPH